MTVTCNAVLFSYTLGDLCTSMSQMVPLHVSTLVQATSPLVNAYLNQLQAGLLCTQSLKLHPENCC